MALKVLASKIFEKRKLFSKRSCLFMKESMNDDVLVVEVVRMPSIIINMETIVFK
jgi:hypothetical protein